MDNFKLIDGTFSVKEAIEILLALVDNKINFHKLKIFSTEECTGHTDEHSEQRVMQLQLIRKELLEHLRQLPADTNIEISSTVSIKTKAIA